jgi:hypothetical protein
MVSGAVAAVAGHRHVRMARNNALNAGDAAENAYTEQDDFS